MAEKHCDPSVRHDFVLLFDVTDGNPNGDPDTGNLPRVDPETMHGLVTDVCLKRKVRDYVDAAHGDEERFKIYVQRHCYLSDHKARAYAAVGAKKGDDSMRKEARDWMCANFYDVRAFGAVLVGRKGEGYNCGQVRGPVQLTFARSEDPVALMDVLITRVALENPGEAVREDPDSDAPTGTMGRKALVPYGLYRTHGFYNAKLAEGTGFDEVDLALIWQALENMWDLDRSASRGMMACRGLYVFSHDSALGCAPAHRLFDTVVVTRIDATRPARRFADYQVSVDEARLPAGVTLARVVD